MKRQIYLFLSGGILIVILAFIWVGANKIYQPPKSEVKTDSREEKNICTSTKDQDRQLCLREVEQALFENYLITNISDLSPTKEVLGGKFYVTNISWLPDRMAIVSYEDGHIALKAKVTLGTIYQNGWPESVEIKSFEILK